MVEWKFFQRSIYTHTAIDLGRWRRWRWEEGSAKLAMEYWYYVTIIQTSIMLSKVYPIDSSFHLYVFLGKSTLLSSPAPSFFHSRPRSVLRISLLVSVPFCFYILLWLEATATVRTQQQKTALLQNGMQIDELNEIRNEKEQHYRFDIILICKSFRFLMIPNCWYISVILFNILPYRPFFPSFRSTIQSNHFEKHFNDILIRFENDVNPEHFTIIKLRMRLIDWIPNIESYSIVSFVIDVFVCLWPTYQYMNLL